MNQKNPTAELESALEAVLEIRAKLAREADLVARAGRELALLEPSIDLEDEAMLARASKLMTLASLAPKKLAALREKLHGAQETLVVVRDRFYRDSVRPRFDDLRRRAIAKAEEALRGNYTDANALRQAALGTALVLALPPMTPDYLIGHQSAVDAEARARSIIALWTKLNSFEANHLS
jgi:hypothetical protein